MVRTPGFHPGNRGSIPLGTTLSMKTPIEVSARHLHLSPADLSKLFGADYQLKILKRLSQKQEFAAKETVTLLGDQGTIKSVRIVGPLRPKTQVEISLTDAKTLGLNPPLRISGDLRGAGTIKLIGPVGQVTVKAVIVAQRHLHLNPTEAKKLKLKSGQIIKVAIAGERKLILDNIVVRVANNFKLMLHLDTDEANASDLRGPKNYGQII